MAYVLLFGALASAALFLFLLAQKKIPRPKVPCFVDLSNRKKMRFYPLEETTTSFEDWAKARKIGEDGKKSWARIYMHNTAFSCSIEDKNHKPVVLKNRKWLRRSVLNHGDVVDVYNICLSLYLPTRASHVLRRAKNKLPLEKIKKPAEGVKHPEFSYLQSTDPKAKPLLLDKNIIFIGRSQNNDIVLRSSGVAPRQAKIVTLSGRATLFNLASDANTFLNGKRVEERELNHKDDISFDGQKFRFYQRIKLD